MRKHTAELVDSIDAAIFNGDEFFEVHARVELREMMQRWECQLTVYDKFEDNDEPI